MTLEKTQSPSVIGPSEIRADWAKHGLGEVSRQYVSKCILKHGCPAHSLEAAREWRTARTSRTNSNPDKGGGGLPSNSPGASAPPPMLGAGGTLEDMLERVRATEFAAFLRWQSAKGYDQAAEAKAYEAAMKTRAAAEQLLASHQKKLGIVVHLADAQQIVDDRLSHIRPALHGLDKELAREFFPEDPAKYRPRFRRVIARVMVASLAIARAKRRLYHAAAPAASSDVGARAA